MHKKEIRFTDYNGNQQQEVFYFNLSRFDMLKLNKVYKAEGGLEEAFNKAVKDNDVDEMGSIFTNLILFSYGIKSEDGKHFEKNEELTQEFANSAAFEALFDELTTDQQALLSFFNGIIPANSRNSVQPSLN